MMARRSRNPKGGNCFSAAIRYLFRHGTLGDADGDPNLQIVHAICGADEILHAWVESGDGVAIDRSDGRRITMPIRDYYAMRRVDPARTWRYTTEQVRHYILSQEQCGPWEGQTDGTE